MSAAGLGMFEVVADPAEVAAFQRAARLESDALPFTYPIRWLALPQVRTAAMALVPEGDLVPFHESQTFEYAESLQVGVRYALTVAAHREATPDRLVIRGEIADAGGAVVAKAETVLRLFSTGPAAV